MKGSQQHWSSRICESKPQWDITSHPLGSKRWWQSGETRSSQIAGGTEEWCSYSENQRKTVWQFLRMSNIEWKLYEAAIPCLGIYLRELEIRVPMKPYTWMFIGALFIRTQRGNKSNVCQLMNGWNKLWSTYTMGYYSAIQRNEVRIHATTWMNLENIMLSERRQSQMATYYMIPLTWNVYNREVHGDRK